MAPQIQRARAALRAIHRMEALRLGRQEQTDEEQPLAGPSTSNDALEQPLLGRTLEEAVVADRRLARPPSMSYTPTPDALHTLLRLLVTAPHEHAGKFQTVVPVGNNKSFKRVANDILEGRQALVRNNPEMADMSDEEKRAHILGYFKSANSWATGTGTALAKTPITDEGSRGPGKCLATKPFSTVIFVTHA